MNSTLETFNDMASGQSKASKEFPSQDEAIPELSPAENTQITLSQQDIANIEKLPPGAKTQAIVSLSKSISLSIDKFMASAPTLLSKDDFKLFLQGIQVSTHKIRLLSEDLIHSDAVGDFIRFPILPIELRLKIWKLCLPAKRIVEFYAKATELDGSGHMERNVGIKQAPNVCFQVCVESRQVALQRYSLQLNWLSLAAKTSASGSIDLSTLKQVWSQEAMQLKTIGTSWFKWNVTLLGHLLKTFKVADELILFLPVLPSASTGSGEKRVVMKEMEDHWRREIMAVDKLWASRAGRTYAGRKKPALFYCMHE